MKNIIILLFFLLLCNSCIHNQCRANSSQNNLSYQSESEKVQLDKQNISQAFIDNVEYFRRFRDYSGRLNDSLEIKHPNSQWDPANFFIPYASRYSLDKDDYINSPLPTQTQITITVDTIMYNTDSLFCIAFVCIYSHYDDIKGIEQNCRVGREYDAKSIIGFRENINDTFKIYPLETCNAIGFPDCESAIKMLKELYFDELIGSRLPFIFETGEYKYNLNNPQIFNTILFKKNSKYPELYNFQLYRNLGNIKEYNYYSNQSDSVKAKWINGN